MRRPALALLVTGLAWALSTAPAASQVEVEGYDILSRLIEESGLDIEARPLDSNQAIVVTDPAGDFEHSSGEPPGHTPGYVDMTQVTKLGVIESGPRAADLFRTFFAKAPGPGARACDRGGFQASPETLGVCTPQYRGPRTFDDGAVVIGATFAAPLPANPDGGCEYVVWLRERGAQTFQHVPQFPNDPADGTNRALIVRAFGGQWSATGVRYNGQFFAADPFPAAAAVRGNQLAFFIPASELAMVEEANYYAFCQTGGFQAETSGADQTMLVPLDLALFPRFQLTRVEASPSPSPSPSSTASPSPTASPTPTISPVIVIDPGGTGSFRTLFIVLMAIGGVLIPVGIWVYHQTRERPRPTPGGSVPEEPGPGPTPGGSMTRDRPVEYAHCDWAAYYSPGGGAPDIVLREAKGKECCVYRISVTTTVSKDDAAARGRQEPDLLGGGEAAPEGRLRIPLVERTFSGLDVAATVGARSGPAGSLEWMQGLGDVAPPEGAGAPTPVPYEQVRSHEEPPDVAAHVEHQESLDLSIVLESMCPGHENTYTGYGGSQIELTADQECTNSAPGECPVEFTASGQVISKAEGEMWWWVGLTAGSDVDELEPVADRLRDPALSPGGDVQVPAAHGISDQHDHEARDRAAFRTSDGVSDSFNRVGDDCTVYLLSYTLLDAGTIVPVAVWPTTDRVTAHTSATAHHHLLVEGSMRRTECLTGPCCGFGECMCAPAISIEFQGSVVAIECDGKSFPLSRPAAPPLGSPAGWPLG